MTRFRQSIEPAVVQAVLLLGLILGVAGCGSSSQPAQAAAAKPKTTNNVASVARTNAVATAASTNLVDATADLKSVFDDSLKNRRDPFFPLSTRIVAAPVTNAVVMKMLIKPTLTLKGIIGKPGRYFALINGTSFAEDEERNVLVGTNRLVRVKCLKISEKTATVRIEGDPMPQELHFNEKPLLTP